MAAIKTQTVPALDRALSIMEILGSSRAGLTLPELVAESKLPRSSVHYLLVTLERRGYIQKNERTSRYLFGLNLFHLANSAMSGLGLRHQAAPYLHSLTRRTRFTSHLAILKEHEAVLIAKNDPPTGLRMATWIGKRMDVHCTAVGKALLSRVTDKELDGIIKEHGLPRHNENTIFSPRKLREELAKVALLGHSVDDEEDELGSRCIGAPVLDGTGRPIAAVSIAGASEDITEANFDSLVRETKAAALALGKVLGSFDSLQEELRAS